MSILQTRPVNIFTKVIYNVIKNLVKIFSHQVISNCPVFHIPIPKHHHHPYPILFLST